MKIAILGSSGAIGSAFVKQSSAIYEGAEIHTFSSRDAQSDFSTYHHKINYADLTTLEAAAKNAHQGNPFDLVICAGGLLHTEDGLMPEKSLRDLSPEKFEQIFAANTIFPAMAAKYFCPLLHRDQRGVFAALSARVGSISDNHLGGWYAYRASKAALNMIIKNTSIEMKRTHKQSIIVGLHPGTVDSDLSKPFQSFVKEGKLFTPDFATESLLNVLKGLSENDSGKCFAWDGKVIEP